ncbi:MAG: Rieske 2Fe-2S domain-containing protein [Caulobacteraceae bacterium]|nr:Rieske 2Fe-2S domain-containing protein [Caulobacter sp.]
MALQAAVDSGTAYERKPPSYRAEITEVGRGTPMGELLRRYWHPVGLAQDAGSTPRPVRALGEDLILFRDGEGQAGLVHSRCCHRGTTLYYGKVEDRGIRCCYHGWLFDREGHCLEMPCEPEMGARMRERVRQPWYPVEELYGLIFAYMGPPEKKPVLPRYTALEEFAEGEFLDTDDQSIGGGGEAVIPCNWLQHWENIVDPYHVPILHGTFSGTQFSKVMDTMPEHLSYREVEYGLQMNTVRTLSDGRKLDRYTEMVFPTLRAVANPLHGQFDVPLESIGWVLPIDDTHFRIYTAGRVRSKGAFLPNMTGENRANKRWFELTPEQRREQPGDFEAQTGQGPITFHSEEHLVNSDKGVVMVRKQIYKQLQRMERGLDPMNVGFDPDQPPLRLRAGNWLGATEAAA